MKTNEETIKFEAGRRYSFRWIGDSDLVSVFEIVRRTDKSVWAFEVGQKDPVRRFKISVWDGEEMIRPYGVYSMSPSLRAGNEVAR